MNPASIAPAMMNKNEYDPNLASNSVSELHKSLNSFNEDAEDDEISQEFTRKEPEFPKEDIRESNEIRNKIIICENFQSFLTILHVGNSIVIYEITFENNERGKDMEQDITLQLYISTFS